MTTQNNNKKTIEVNTKMTDTILSGQTRLIDLTDFKTKDYIKCKGIYAEVIEGRIKVAYVRCPQCRRYINIYKDELKDREGHTKNKRCLCGFSKPFELVNWKKSEY